MEGDRISLLPDELLHHILSFLDTQTVIKATYLLSKRWTNLWSSTPSLLFDFPSFSCPHSNREICFRRFIKRVLSHRRMHLTPLSKVKKLSLCFVAEPLGSRSNSEEYSDSLKFDVGDNIVFKLLFHFAALNHVEELCIEGGYLDFADWYHHFSTCRSIKLSGFYEGMWVSHSFEFLKCLEINNFYYPFQLELEGGDVFPTYPLLERLILRGSCFERARITAPKLEYLEMESITVKDDKFISVILLFAPKLASIKLYNVVPALISADDFLSLNKLEVFLDSFTVSVFFYEVEQLVVERLGGLWNLLRKATSLTLNSTVLEVWSCYFTS